MRIIGRTVTGRIIAIATTAALGAGVLGGAAVNAASLATGAPIAGVCVYAGPPVDCPAPNLNTDAGGNWAIDFPSGVTWQFNFQHPLYAPKLQLTGTTINVQMVKK